MRTMATVGVYGFGGEAFLERLRLADVRLLLDVRQRRGVRGPDYAWANSRRLQAALAASGIAYEHHPELAPTTELRQLQYAEDDRRRVGKRSRVELAPEYVRRYTAEILDRVDLAPIVAALPSEGAAALFCVERDPEACHRSLIAARLAERHGCEIEHLRPESRASVALLLQACLGGGRSDAEHPAIPRSPEALASDGREAVEAGASVLHLHPCDAAGVETLSAKPCAAALRAVRAACPGIPISLSTSEGIEADPGRRLELVAGWTELPDLVTANQGERGIVELCEHLMARGVGIEAGLLGVEDARAFVSAGIVERCVRALIEPLDADPATAVAHAAAIEQVLVDAGVGLEQVHHGDGVATWHVMERAIERGHGVRAGLEDTTVLRDGRTPGGNDDLVRAGAAMLAA